MLPERLYNVTQIVIYKYALFFSAMNINLYEQMLYSFICLLSFSFFLLQAECKTSYNDACTATGRSKASCKIKSTSLASLCALSNGKGELLCNSACKSIKGQAAGKCGLFNCDCYKTVGECAKGNLDGQGQCGN